MGLHRFEGLLERELLLPTASSLSDTAALAAPVAAEEAAAVLTTDDLERECREERGKEGLTKTSSPGSAVFEKSSAVPMLVDARLGEPLRSNDGGLKVRSLELLRLSVELVLLSSSFDLMTLLLPIMEFCLLSPVYV